MPAKSPALVRVSRRSKLPVLIRATDVLLGLDAIKNLLGSVSVGAISLYNHYTDTRARKPNRRAVDSLPLGPMQTASSVFTSVVGERFYVFTQTPRPKRFSIKMWSMTWPLMPKNNKTATMTQTTSRPSDTKLSQFRVKGEIPVPMLIGWLTLAAIPILLFFAWRSLDRGMPGSATTLIVFAVLLSVNGIVYLISHNSTVQRRGFITAITILFTYLAINAVEDGSAIIWLFAYPPIIFYISEAKVGVLACSGGLAGIALLFSPLGDLAFDSPYSTSFRLTMLAVLGFEMSTCYVLDQSRRRSKLGLLKLAAEFEYAAKHDALTGLANRREAHEQLEAEYQRYLRNSRGFSVLLMDIDLFKFVNDNHGHQVGDETIVMVARTLQEHSRKVDTLARWGGEEYLVLLPETDTVEAVKTANRIRQTIASTAIKTQGGSINTTISVGVATIHGAESVDRLLQRADEALYRAKALGRNKVCDFEATHG